MNKKINLQNAGFESVRIAHLSENTEDYVELIADLINDTGVANTTSIANALGVAKPTVSKSLKKLSKDGFVKYEPYKPITLTEKGKKLAKSCKARHKIVYDFLIALGVSKKTAEIDAEGLEHHASSETLKIFEKFTKKKS
ncbi:MAG: manganese-binding transcriptional regulator MntR [Alphaproteobacteria bacterium]